MTTKTYKVQEFGSQMQISAELRRRMSIDDVEQLLKENLRKDALAKGYTEVSPPEMEWGTQHFRIAEEEGEYSYVRCTPTDKGAFVYVGVLMRVIDKGSK